MEGGEGRELNTTMLREVSIQEQAKLTITKTDDGDEVVEEGCATNVFDQMSVTMYVEKNSFRKANSNPFLGDDVLKTTKSDFKRGLGQHCNLCCSALKSF